MSKVISTGVNVKVVKYDSLLEDRKGTTSKVFNYLDIPADYVSIACQVWMKHQHQSNESSGLLSYRYGITFQKTVY